ncbi:hypothetical protein RT94_20575 [Pseudomonas viridiflava]|nr:hypothetical protein RT94_20575 [Pseudomonas viridiflava]
MICQRASLAYVGTQSVLSGIPTQSVGTIIIVFLQEDLCITMSAERRNDQRDLKQVDHAHACAQRYTRVLLRPRTVGGGLPAMLFLKRPISD